MEKMSPQPQRSSSTVPLARDQEGNPIELPDGAVGWRIRRQTGGRPRLLLDGRKQPMLFPLDYTIADVEDILPPGNYLLDVIDKGGEPLGVTIGLALGIPRNAETVEPDNENSAPSVVPTALPATTSEVRLVLEANVRAMQMAFIHNQRTLEIGLRMAETLRDGVQVLANAQADWIKSVSSARGFFRNAGPLPAPVEVKQLTVNTGGGEVDNNGGDDGDGGAPDDSRDGDGGHGDGDDGHDASTTSAHWSEQFLPIVNQVAMQVMPAINAWSAKQMSEREVVRLVVGATLLMIPPSWRRVPRSKRTKSMRRSWRRRSQQRRQMARASPSSSCCSCSRRGRPPSSCRCRARCRPTSASMRCRSCEATALPGSPTCLACSMRRRWNSAPGSCETSSQNGGRCGRRVPLALRLLRPTGVDPGDGSGGSGDGPTEPR